MVWGATFSSARSPVRHILRQRLGFEEMMLKQVKREVGNTKAWGSKHLAVNETLRKRVSSSKKYTYFAFSCSAGGHGDQFNVNGMRSILCHVTGIRMLLPYFMRHRFVCCRILVRVHYYLFLEI